MVDVDLFIDNIENFSFLKIYIEKAAFEAQFFP